ncbi:MAG: ribosome maturation factor RimP [Actinomycetota bacterium]
MTPLELSPAVRAICQAVADELQVELVDVHFFVGRQRILSVIVDRIDGGVDMELVTEISRRVSDELDAHDVVEGGSYTLEVASAGLERPLVKPGDYHRFGGRQILVKTHALINGRRSCQGSIKSVGSESFVLELPRGVDVEIAYDAVKKANLVVDWEAELRRASINEESTHG